MREQISAYPEIRAPRWGVEESEFQIVKPKAPYVFGIGRNNAVIHTIRHIRLRWWTTGPSGAYLMRLQSPRMLAETKCGVWRNIGTATAKTCELPNSDAVMCAACNRKGRNFPRGQKHEVSLALAKIRLGCAK